MKILCLLLCLLLVLAGCAPKTPVTTPGEEVITPAPAPSLDPDEDPVLSYSLDGVNTIREQQGLTINITVPVMTTENDSAAQVINSYYSLLSGKVLDYAEGDLTPQPDRGITYSVTADYDVTYMTEEMLSVLWQVHTVSTGEMPGIRTYTAANFDPATGNLFTFADVFSDPAAVRALFVEKAREVIGMLQETHYYYEQWYQLADSALDTDCFYLTEDAVYVFYSQEALGTYTAIPLTYVELADYFAK